MTSGRFVKCYVHFKTNNVTEALYGRFFVYHTGTASLVGAKRMSLKKGTVESEWTQHPNEVKSIVTSIDQDGVKVKHSEAGTYTQMDSVGFTIRDSDTDDVLAWLSSKEQWTELKVDKAFANNIETIYQGDSDLYINHSFTGECKGTQSNPFNSFSQLATHLQSACIINKNINIYVLTTTSEITEKFTLNGLKGSGTIKITYDGNCVHRIGENGGWCLSFANIYNAIVIRGNRSSYNSDDGAILCDNGKYSGMSFTDCRQVDVGYININCLNWGIKAVRSNVRGNRIDFCDTYCAYDISEHSICSDSDGVGNCGDFFRVYTGSIFTYGDSGGGYRPMGNKIETSGKYFLIGNERTVTASFRTKPPVPPTSTYTQSFSWTSHKTYQYQWSNWNDSDCKQGSWGYGLRGGHMFFDMSSIRSFLSGTVLDGNTITLTRASSGGLSSGANVYINGSTCSSASGTPSYGGQTLLGTLAWGETKTFTLPKAIVQGLKSGSYNSLAVYVNNTANNCYLNIVNASITLKTQK